jgi:hypothetical protein
MTSGSGLATSLGWQHLTAIEPELPSTTSSHRRERKTPPLNNLTELHESLAKVVHGNRDLVEVLTEITRIARREMPSIECSLCNADPGREALYGCIRRADGFGC